MGGDVVDAGAAGEDRVGLGFVDILEHDVHGIGDERILGEHRLEMSLAIAVGLNGFS